MKLQIQMKNKEAAATEEAEAAIAIWDCGSPLYDSYELVSLSHHIERHLMALPSLGGSRRFITRFYRDSNAISSTLSTSNVGSTRMAKGSSMVGSMREFVGWKMLKRKMMNGERKDKAKKLKTGFYSFCNRICLWRGNSNAN